MCRQERYSPGRGENVAVLSHAFDFVKSECLFYIALTELNWDIFFAPNVGSLGLGLGIGLVGVCVIRCAVRYRSGMLSIWCLNCVF